LWRESTQVPLMISAPGLGQPGARCNDSVSLLDLYPTLIELCGVPAREGLEGASLTPLLRDPAARRGIPAVCTAWRGNHAVITDGWRYIRYVDGTEELYDTL